MGGRVVGILIIFFIGVSFSGLAWTNDLSGFLCKYSLPVSKYNLTAGWVEENLCQKTVIWIEVILVRTVTIATLLPESLIFSARRERPWFSRDVTKYSPESKTNEPRKFLSSSGTNWSLSVSGYIHLFSSIACLVWKPAQFQVQTELWRCITYRSNRVYGNIYTYQVIFSFFKSQVLRKKLVKMFVGSVQIISRLDSQSKFHMFTPFSGRHVGGTQSSLNMCNMAAPYWSL